MIPYKNANGNSNVRAFSIGEDYIDVQFGKGEIYRYSVTSAGSYNIEKMKALAVQGWGLNSYIMRNVKKGYERRFI